VLESVNARIPLDSPHIETRMVRSASVPPIFANRAAGLEAAVAANDEEKKAQEKDAVRNRVRQRGASIPS
jgi:hypothetical protein